MLLGYRHISLPILLLLALVRVTDGEESASRRVRVVYLVSQDREENVEYTAAIEHAIKNLQNWYGQQGVLLGSITAVVQCTRPRSVNESEVSTMLDPMSVTNTDTDAICS